MSSYTVYGRPGCSYCVAATQLLQSKGLAFEYVDMQAQGIAPAELEDITGRPVRTVPQILRGEEYIGGYRELAAYIKRAEAA